MVLVAPKGGTDIVDKRAETNTGEGLDELLARYEVLRRAEQSAGVGVWEIDIASDTVRGTPQFLRIMGLPPTGDPIPMEVLRGLRLDTDRERVNEGYRDAVATGADVYESEYRIRRSDGQERWIWGRGRVVRDRAGLPVRYTGADIDITDRKAAEHARAESESRLRLAVEAANLGIWDWNLLTNEMTWTERAKAMAGVPADAPFSFEDARAVTHPDDLPRTAEMARRALDPEIRSRKAYEYRLRRPDGTIRWVLANGEAVFAKIGGQEQAVRYTGTLQDITERKEAEEHRQLLVRELQHRVNNTLALVSAIANQTFRGDDSPDTKAAVAAFSARIAALGQAHTILTRESWQSASLAEVVSGALAPHHQERIKIDGPHVRLPARRALSLALALNELATNAAKYGALSNARGRIDIAWSVEPQAGGPHLHFRWTESDGPLVATPRRTSFGTRLIRDMLAADFNGTVEVSYLASGVVCVLVAPLDP